MWQGDGNQIRKLEVSKEAATKASKVLDNNLNVTEGKSRQGRDDEHKGTGGLRCICFNARSVPGKADEFRAWISTWEYDIIGITET